MDFSKLTGTDLTQTYQGLMAALRGTDPASMPLPGLTEAQFREDLTKFVTRFDEGMNFGPDDEPPKDRITSIMSKVAKGGTPAAGAETALFNSFILLNGYGGNEGITFDSTISDQERAAATKIAADYAANRTTADIHSDADTARATAETTRLAEAKVETARISAEHTVEQQGLTTEFGLRALGVKDMNELAYLHNDSLHRLFDIPHTAGKESFNAVIEKLNGSPANAHAALSMIIRSGDYKAEVLADLQSGDPDRIREAKAVINLAGLKIGGTDVSLEMNGVFNQATKDGAGVYLAQEQGMGQAFFGSTFDNDFEAFAEGKGLSPLDQKTQDLYITANPDAFVYDISSYAIAQGVESKALPVDIEIIRGMNGAGARLASRLDAMEGKEFDQLRGMYVSDYLSDKANFRAYDNALKLRDSSTLTTALNKIEVATPAVINVPEVATAASVAEHKDFTAVNVKALPALQSDQIALSDQIEAAGTSAAWDSIYERIPANFVPNENTPPEVRRFMELRADIDSSGAHLTSYKLNPLALNTNDVEGIRGQYSVTDPKSVLGINGTPPADIKIVGFTGGVQSSIRTRLEVKELMAQNAHMEYFQSLSPEKRQAILRHLDDPSLPLEKTTPDVIPGARSTDGLVSQIISDAKIGAQVAAIRDSALNRDFGSSAAGITPPNREFADANITPDSGFKPTGLG